MLPDDPRHGSHAGAVQHYKDGEQSCTACREAATRADKGRTYLRHIGQPANVELGDRACRIIETGPLNRIADATGMTHHRLRDYANAGPQQMVRRATRDRILAADGGWTVVGLQRRLQALTMLGWSMRQLADRTGVAVDTLKRLRRGNERKFVKSNAATAVLAVYDELHMTPAPAGASRTKTLTDAQAHGWAAPLAWGSRNIDDPNAKPYRGGRDHAVDEVVVQRLLNQQRTPSTPAEKTEAMRRWVANGGSRRQLALIHGWRDGRYSNSEEAAS